jgi:hypothetical protein
MKIRYHLLLAAISITLWFIYVLIGLPYNYFQDLGQSEILLLLLISFFGVIPLLAVVVLSLIKVTFLKASVWFAFYASLPLFLLDFFFVGIMKGEGFHFLVSHWYLTLGYFAVWIELPLIGKTLEQLSIKIWNQDI